MGALETLKLSYDAQRRASGARATAIVGVVASGNLEVLFERVLPDTVCEVQVVTSIRGFGDVWRAVVGDFVDRKSSGGLRISINDGGARPDTVSLRLMQGSAVMEGR